MFSSAKRKAKLAQMPVTQTTKLNILMPQARILKFNISAGIRNRIGVQPKPKQALKTNIIATDA